MTEPSRFRSMSEQTRKVLETEFIGRDTRNALHYHLMEYFETDAHDNTDKFLRVTNLIHRSRNLPNLSYNGEFIQEELNYMGGIVQTAFSSLDTIEILKIICDLCAYQAMDVNTVNEILKEDGFPFKLVARDPLPYIDPFDGIDLDEFANGSIVEPALRQLLMRMDDAYRRKDYPGVLAAGSNVIEAIARRQSNHPRAASTTFNKVKKMFLQHSSLPTVLKNEFDRIYVSRNKTPNAAHGNLEIDGNVTAEEAATVISICFTSVKHYWLFRDHPPN